MTTEVNPVLGDIEDAIQRFSLFALSKVGMNALFTAVPWLNVWPLRSIIEGLSEMLVNKLFAGIRLMVDLSTISFLNSSHQKVFEKNILSLRALARGYGIESDAFKRARENAKQNFADAIRYNGAGL